MGGVFFPLALLVKQLRSDAVRLFHRLANGVLDVGGFYQHLLAHVQLMCEKGLLREANLQLFTRVR